MMAPRISLFGTEDASPSTSQPSGLSNITVLESGPTRIAAQLSAIREALAGLGPCARVFFGSNSDYTLGTLYSAGGLILDDLDELHHQRNAAREQSRELFQDLGLSGVTEDWYESDLALFSLLHDC